MIRAWLLDDEPLALRRLTRMLEETKRVTVIGGGNDPLAAVASVTESKPDVLFLDIEMPGMTGFEFLEKLTVRPAIVFTTAYDHYAVKAFEAEGTDYLLKPVTPEALERAVSRVERLVKSGETVDYRSMIERLSNAIAKSGGNYATRLASRTGDRVQLVDVANITHFFADDKLTYAATPGRNYVIDESIHQLETRLDPAKFVRIHRAHLVSLGSVAEVFTFPGGRLMVRLNDAARTELPVSRDRVRQLKDHLGI